MRLPNKVYIGMQLKVHKVDPNWKTRARPRSGAQGMTVCGLYMNPGNWAAVASKVTCVPCLEKREYKGAGEVLDAV